MATRSDAEEAGFATRVGLAIAESLESLVPGMPRLTLKRPNDLFLAGKKVAGILCEARWEGPTPSWVVVGLGLNVSNRLPQAVSDLGTTLADEGISATPDDLAPWLAGAIAQAALAAGPLTAAEEAALSAREQPA